MKSHKIGTVNRSFENLKEENRRKAMQRVERRYKLKKVEHQLSSVQVKMVTLLIICAISFCTFGTFSFAQEEQVAYVKVDDYLNLRRGPSTEEEIIGKLPPNQRVVVLEDDQNGWTYIRTKKGKEGYVSSEFLTKEGEQQKEEKKEPKGQASGELLTSVSIDYPKSGTNRNYNMAKACEAINGKELAQGEVFAWYDVDKNYNDMHIKANGVVGPAEQSTGYKLSTIIVDKKYVKGYGGGVCQVATTLFNAINNIGIEPIERHMHSKASAYAEKGMDATVAYSEDQMYRKNFVFRNTSDKKIRLVAYTEGSKVTVEIYKTN